MTVTALALAGVLAWAMLAGRTERAVYLGTAGGDLSGRPAMLLTYPERGYRMARGAALADLRVACRYDFTYAPSFGWTAAPRVRMIRHAALVDCP